MTCGICGEPAYSTGLCRTHTNLRREAGVSAADYLALWSPTCAIVGCGSPATDLDHDHSCCVARHKPGEFSLHSGYRVPFGDARKRCGRCNRAWLCHPCNAAVGIVERGNGDRIPADREARLLDYLMEHM